MLNDGRQSPVRTQLPGEPPPGSAWPAGVPRPRPPVWDVFAVTVDVGPAGHVVAQLEIDDRMLARPGLAGAGLVALLADSVLGTDAALHARRRIATASLTVDLLGRPPETGLLRAVCGPSARRAGYLNTTATIRDAGDTEVARVSGWFTARGGPLPTSPLAREPARPAPVGAGTQSFGTGTQTFGTGTQSFGTDLVHSPLGRTLGLRRATCTPGDTAVELPDVGRLSNSGGTLHGGVGALIASLVALDTLGDDARPEVLSLTCCHLRAAGGDGVGVQVTGRQIRRGRTSAVVQGDVLTADGRFAVHTVLTTALDAAPDA